METQENNILIDVFMGEWLQLRGFYSGELNYGTDWGVLMPVVEKIESLGYWTEICFSFLGTKKRPGPLVWCEITKENHADLLLDDCYTDICRGEGTTKIEAVYNAVVGFINWYNSPNK